jgi:hypothetical protein
MAAAKVKQHRFRTLIMPGPAAGENAVRGHLGRTHTCCLVQPCRGMYFPAVISPDGELAPRAVTPAVVSAALATGEAEAFFAPGQLFTVWADAVVGHAVHADRLIGQGVIVCQLSFPPRAHDGRAEREMAGQAGRHSLAALRVRAAHDHGRRLAV